MQQAWWGCHCSYRMCSCVSEWNMLGLCLLFNVDIQFLIAICCQHTNANVKYTNGKISENEYLRGEYSCGVLIFYSVFWVMTSEKNLKLDKTN